MCPSRVLPSQRKKQGEDHPETGVPSDIVHPVATQPWIMTMRSSTPAWEETLVFAESYRRLLVPESLILFELVNFMAGSSLKDARKVLLLAAAGYDSLPLSDICAFVSMAWYNV